MKVNEGTADRGLRVVLGIALLVAGFVWLGAMSGVVLGIAAALVGAVLVVTGFVGFCPAYSLMGIKTCPLGK
jgi:apolipoprotein N-acyltransferase